MKYKIKFQKTGFIFVISFLCLAASCEQNSEQPSAADPKYPPVSLYDTEQRVIRSKFVNVDFEIYISLPFSYSKSDTTYPVLFSLDANRSFGMVSNLVTILSTPHKEIPEIIVVGIAYPINGLEDWVIARNRDYTPTHKPEYDKYWVDRLSKLSGRDDIVVHSGGAERFLYFIREELIPFIESNYRVSSSDRALLGFSLSGLFTIYALFQHPETFQRYLAGSPSINWDGPFVFNIEKDFAAAHQDLPVKLFMSAGGLERKSMLANMKKMSDLLRSRNYPGLQLETQIFENETHASSAAGAISRGLKVIYK